MFIKIYGPMEVGIDTYYLLPSRFNLLPRERNKNNLPKMMRHSLTVNMQADAVQKRLALTINCLPRYVNEALLFCQKYPISYVFGAFMHCSVRDQS